MSWPDTSRSTSVERAAMSFICRRTPFFRGFSRLGTKLGSNAVSYRHQPGAQVCAVGGPHLAVGDAPDSAAALVAVVLRRGHQHDRGVDRLEQDVLVADSGRAVAVA